jgi:hypothetical protein
MALALKIRRNTDELAQAIERLHELKEQAIAASSRFEEQQAYVIGMMGDQKTAKAIRHKATVVRGNITTYNEAGLKKALGAATWNKITKKVLDRPKLEQAVNDGEIDINVVAAHAEVKPKKPYVSFSKINDDEE